jgi:ankyrin repeat protein
VKDDKGVPLLLHATMLQDRAIVQSLLEHRADPNISDSNAVYPVQIACQNSRGQALVIMLLNAGADPNTRNPDGHTLLNWASFQGQLHIIKILLEHGANSALLKIDSRLMNPSHAGQGMKDSPLHTAVAFGRLDVVQLLICHGADINLRDRTQETVIHVAQSRLSTYTEHAFSLQLQFITFLLQSGADLNARRHDGKTSLHLAAGSGKLVTVGALCECGADVNLQDSPGETALHSVARLCDESELPGGRNNYCTQLVRLLYSAGANLDAENREGKTPLQVARESFCDSYQIALSVCRGDSGLRASFAETASYVSNRHNSYDKFPDSMKLPTIRTTASNDSPY